MKSKPTRKNSRQLVSFGDSLQEANRLGSHRLRAIRLPNVRSPPQLLASAPGARPNRCFPSNWSVTSAAALRIAAFLGAWLSGLRTGVQCRSFAFQGDWDDWPALRCAIDSQRKQRVGVPLVPTLSATYGCRSTPVVNQPEGGTTRAFHIGPTTVFAAAPV